jgi:hypothetical protein
MNTNTNNTNNTNTINCPVVQEMQRSFPDEWHYRIANSPFDTQLAQKLRDDAYVKVFQQLEKEQEQEIREEMDTEESEDDDDYDEDMERSIAMGCFNRRIAAEARKNPRKNCQRCELTLESNNLGTSCVHCIFALKTYII